MGEKETLGSYNNRYWKTFNQIGDCPTSLAIARYKQDGYDPLDPNGNITIKWDVMQMNEDTQDMYRHIEPPGAETTEQGNCSTFRGKQLPHCCEKKPVIIDLMPGASYNKQVANCCKGGVLSSITQGLNLFGTAFQMNVGASTTSTNISMPGNFTLELVGYTCGDPVEVAPSKFIKDNGRRQIQALGKSTSIRTKLYWRVKITVTNLNYAKNYSQWNLGVLHPNMRSVTEVFSFNYNSTTGSRYIIHMS
ncbi:hypothetical protein HYC85_025706 [Camellia sinensis]|uniref:COBRA C-terminal domain-containing protein n=1 Tax=Camellia sinensis TaxID=4442 RepID=A0A7J7GBX3_CAMSI|nr:hypothetical protein HYC85_025706 [Camellia sinensis]